MTDLHNWLPGLPLRRGKVRDIYDFNERLLIIASDRISAFDWILPTVIPDKGRVLTQLSQFWFQKLHVPHHLLSTEAASVTLPPGTNLSELRGRCMVTRKASVYPVECVVRGYLSGSGWKEYQESGAVCGVTLPSGLVESDKLPEPIFTPATKAVSGHDENIPFSRVQEIIGADAAGTLRETSLDIYRQASAYAAERGIIIADTKFEFGEVNGSILLVDEVLTPDSSRFWPVSEYRPGGAQPSYDKQFVRDWLLQSGWDRNSPPPPLPADVVIKTRAKYIDAYERLTGQTFHV